MMKSIFDRLHAIMFFWFRYTCPFCKGTFYQMLPFGLNLTVLSELDVVGGGFRKNAICPKCHSSDRERLVYLYLLQETDLFSKGGTILHIAPEYNLKRVLSSKLNIAYTCIDLNMKNVDIRADITSLPFASESFDYILCNHVLEHVLDETKGLKEINRVLKPQGIAILQVPLALKLNKTLENPDISDSSERKRMFGQEDHVRLYGMDYPERLSRVGFKVSIQCGDSFAKKYALNKRENVYAVMKR